MPARLPLARDTATLEFVVSDRGKALPATARLDYSGDRPLVADNRERYAGLMSMLNEFPYDAGRVAGCRVPAFVCQVFKPSRLQQ
jgi:hypothetical protein